MTARRDDTDDSELQRILDLSKQATAQQIRALAKKLQGKRIIMINSTAKGGGVSVLLESFVPLFQRLGIEIIWKVLDAPSSFFDATKQFHNALQGDGDADMTEHINTYDRFYKNEFETHNPEITALLENLTSNDIVIMHDPQPLALIRYRKNDGSKWIWRCHIDLSNPHEKLWEFIYSYAKGYDRVIVSKESFIKNPSLAYNVIPPSINPVSDKNKELSDEEMVRQLKKYDVPLDKGLITQISRLDKWKDPLGVIHAYEEFRTLYNDDSHRLVLVYNTAVDDPEGKVMYDKVVKAVNDSLYSEDIIMVVGDHPLVVNALQRYSTIVFQKSLREGFGLTVSEAMWKKTPVIATNAGGIPLQIIDGYNGFLIDTYDVNADGSATDETEVKHHIKMAATRIHQLLENPELVREMGENARETVRKKFLISRHMLNYMTLFDELLSERTNG